MRVLLIMTSKDSHNGHSKTRTHPLYVAFVWHMHQPYYKDVLHGNFFMPWVRLHAAKDYVDMALILDEFPDIRVTINLVPVLLEQVLDYAENVATDVIWDLSVPDPSSLSEAEKCVILERFFHAQYETMIRPYPRYREIHDLRGEAPTPEDLRALVRRLDDQAFRDLQVWYNLVWIDPLFVESDPRLRQLFVKDRGFTEEDKRYVLAKHREILNSLIPTYRQRLERGQIEISTTPYFHPILPLICDTNLAHVARPDLPLPKRRFQHPEDAEEHVRRAVELYKRLFGRPPRGMWPAEGSVAPDIIPILAKYGIEWIASDEEVLAHSFGQSIQRDLRGNVLNPDFLYRPYYVQHNGHQLKIVFRDHHLSDLIGFQYAGWDPEEAAEDFVRRLEIISLMPERQNRPWLVPIILDGENCWEHYQSDGLPFLRALYGRLSESGALKTVTLSDYFDQIEPETSIPHLFAGSWINHDFSIWIGHREDNRSWDYLHDIRDLLVNHIAQHQNELTPEQIESAWRSLYIAEGSDWNWWYGEDHSSGMDDLFDQLYRDHLAAACKAVGLEPPGFLRIPISRHSAPREIAPPISFISPSLDGHITHFYEWYGAGHYDPVLASTAMHPGRMRIQRLYYGFDQENFYFRIDVDPSVIRPVEPSMVEMTVHLVSGEKTWELKILLEQGASARVSTVRATFGTTSKLAHRGAKKEAFALSGSEAGSGNAPRPFSASTEENSTPQDTDALFAKVAVGEIIEIAIPRPLLPVQAGDVVDFYVSLIIDGREIERTPAHTYLHIRVPPDHFEQIQWSA